MSNRDCSNLVKGDGAEILLIAELITRGFNVSVPWGHNNIYDLVVEGKTSGKLYKVQVKMRMPFRKKYIKINNCDKYVDNIDMLVVLMENEWYFMNNRYLKEYFETHKDSLCVNSDKIYKKNWEIFV
jgi:hypothetical protein